MAASFISQGRFGNWYFARMFLDNVTWLECSAGFTGNMLKIGASGLNSLQYSFDGGKTVAGTLVREPEIGPAAQFEIFLPGMRVDKVWIRGLAASGEAGFVWIWKG